MVGGSFFKSPFDVAVPRVNDLVYNQSNPNQTTIMLPFTGFNRTIFMENVFCKFYLLIYMLQMSIQPLFSFLFFSQLTTLLTTRVTNRWISSNCLEFCFRVLRA